MAALAIHAEQLGKCYQLGAKQRSQYMTFQERLMEAARAPFQRLGRNRSASDDERLFWAVNDVSFDIRNGDTVGIIGRNGAGKSTLLKILTRITEPSRGRATMYGRVGSLLEVGTGFHPELTGRENTFLNGAILGMTRAEIARRFDEIVAFAEIEKFIDTPVKFYSSGMYVRLAFAVAAHLEPEILIVDEVLAVGDIRFQKKCLNKMQDVGEEGRTVLFVSHSMPAITRLCSRAILLDQGTMLQDGPTTQVVGTYLNHGMGTTAARTFDEANAPGGEVARLRAVRIKDTDGEVSDVVDIRRPLLLEMEYDVLQPGYVLMPHYHMSNEDDLLILTSVDQDQDWRQKPRPVGRYTSTAIIPGNFLAEGTFFIDASLTTLAPVVQQFSEQGVVAFQVIDSVEGNSARGDWAGRMGGVVRPVFEWQTTYRPAEAIAIAAD